MKPNGMKNILLILLCLPMLWSCHRDEARVIPSDVLGHITHDIYLANAYVSLKDMNVDSLEIYQPIFAKYGYNSGDMLHTIRYLSRHKSARFSDILNQVQNELEKEYAVYSRKVDLLDTIDRRIDRKFQEVVYSDSTLSITSTAQVKKLRIDIPARTGIYEARYSYLIDSLDSNFGVEAQFTPIFKKDSMGAPQRQFMARRTRREMLLRLEITDTTIRKVRLDLASYRTTPNSNPSIHFDSIRIMRYLPTEEGRDSIMRILLPFHPVIPANDERTTTDLGPLSALPRGTAERGGADPRR